MREDGRTSKVIVPQYFRARWWARLGHDLAWAYLWLRSTVYDNPAEDQRRDTCWLSALDVILTAIGRPREWWRRNVENAASSGEGWALADFFAQLETQKGRDPSHPQRVARQFRVALDIPVAPEDRALYDTLLRTWPAQGIVLEEHALNDGVSRPSPGCLPHLRTPARRGAPHPCTPERTESATTGHTGIRGVCRICAHRQAGGAPHWCTGVCHIRAQGFKAQY